MGKYICKRIVCMLVTLLIIITLTFIAMKMIPGDPIGAKYEKASKEVRANIEAIYGLDKPLFEQYTTYLKNIAKGNLGLSITNPGKTANDIISETAPVSFQLGIVSLLTGLLLGCAGGFFSGLKRNGVLDYGVIVIATLGISIPNFVAASLLQYTFTYKFPLFPPIGWDTGGLFGGGAYIVLPTAALAFGTVAVYAKYMREAVTDTADEEYVLMARAKGLPKRTILRKYILRNSVIPIVTISAQQVVALLTGSVVIENIYAIPGIGRYFVNSVMQRDYTVIMAVTIFYSLIFMLATLAADLLYYKINPKLREERMTI